MKKILETSVFNRVGDELVFFEGVSDWGTIGWFSGWRVSIPGRNTSYHPSSFFESEEDMRKEYERVLNGETEDYL